MCNHAYIKRIDKTYYDKTLKCRIRIETSTCIFCGQKETERSFYMALPKRKLPKFIKDDLSNISLKQGIYTAFIAKCELELKHRRKYIKWLTVLLIDYL